MEETVVVHAQINSTFVAYMKYDHRIYTMNTGCIRPTVCANSWQVLLIVLLASAIDLCVVRTQLNSTFDAYMKYDYRIYPMDTGCIRSRVLTNSWQVLFDAYIKTDYRV